MRISHLFEFLGELALSPRNSFSCLLVDSRIDMHDWIWVLLLFSLSTANTGQLTPDILKNIWSQHITAHVHLMHVNFCFALERLRKGGLALWKKMSSKSSLNLANVFPYTIIVWSQWANDFFKLPKPLWKMTKHLTVTWLLGHRQRMLKLWDTPELQLSPTDRQANTI